MDEQPTTQSSAGHAIVVRTPVTAKSLVVISPVADLWISGL
jgi:hypothetical protein